MPPEVLTPVRDTKRTCNSCGSMLTMTGKVIDEYVDIKAAPRRKAWKGYVPSLLITLCPVCDVRDTTGHWPGDVTELPDDGAAE